MSMQTELLIICLQKLAMVTKLFSLAYIKSAFLACTIRWRKPHADKLLADECLWHQCSTWRISEKSDENLRGLEGIKAIVDDILIWGDDDSFEEATATHDKKLLALLKRSQRKNVKRKNVKLNNKEKFRLKKSELFYMHMGVV